MRPRPSGTLQGMRRLGWLLLPAVVASLVVLDPPLAALVPADTWVDLRLGSSPLRATPVVVAILLLGLVALRLGRLATSFAVLAVTLLMATSQLNGIGAGPLDLFDLTLFGLAALWLARVGTDVGRTVPLSPLLFCAAGLIVLGVAHMPLLNPVTWFVGMIGLLRVTLIAFLVVDLCRDRRMIDFALTALVAVATASGLVGLVQFALAYLGVVHLTLLEPPSSAFKPTPLGFVMRASGLCITAQHFSSFLVYALPVALWRATERRSAVAVACCLAILGGIGVSLNFGGMFAALLVVGLFPVLRWPRLAIHYALALMAILAVSYFAGVLQIVYDLTFGDAGVAKGVDQRKTLFGLGVEQAARSPLIGTGLRGFSDVDGNFWGRPVHNLFGQAMTELGLTAVLIMGAIFVSLSIGLVRLLGHAALARPAGMILLMLGAALLIGQSEPNLDQSNLWLVFALAQATIAVARRDEAGRRGG